MTLNKKTKQRKMEWSTVRICNLEQYVRGGDNSHYSNKISMYYHREYTTLRKTEILTSKETKSIIRKKGGGAIYRTKYEGIRFVDLLRNLELHGEARIVNSADDECVYQLCLCFTKNGDFDGNVLMLIAKYISNYDFGRWVIFDYGDHFYVYPPVSRSMKTQKTLATLLTKTSDYVFSTNIYVENFISPYKVKDISRDNFITTFEVNGVEYNYRFGECTAPMARYCPQNVDPEFYELFLISQIGFTSQA